jgi:hypothetical protein
LHRLANRGQQLGREGVQVDLLVHAVLKAAMVWAAS